MSRTYSGSIRVKSWINTIYGSNKSISPCIISTFLWQFVEGKTSTFGSLSVASNNSTAGTTRHCNSTVESKTHQHEYRIMNIDKKINRYVDQDSPVYYLDTSIYLLYFKKVILWKRQHEIERKHSTSEYLYSIGKLVP